MRAKVVYLCWGCGSSITKVEVVEAEGKAVQWNICPDCQKKSKKRGL